MDQHVQVLSAAAPGRRARLASLRAALAAFAVAAAAIVTCAAPVPAEDWWADPRFERLPAPLEKATLPLDDSRLFAVTDRGGNVSRDEGKTWATVAPLVTPTMPAAGRPRSGPMLRTTRGTLVLIYGDPTTRNLSWDRQTGEPKPDMRADVWAIRSTDGGQTWTDRQEISALFHHVSPYCLSLIQLTQANDSTLIAPLQLRVGNRNRSILATVVSRDEGRTWQAGQTLLDIGGAGVHDGLLEPSLAALRDGRVWMLIRTNLDWFYESYSADSGLTWSAPVATAIDASSSPGYLLRLRSGRLMLLWNRLKCADSAEPPRRTGKGYSERSASWQREELSLAFSEDDGRTWSPPIVIVRHPAGAAYPSAFERRSGEIWLSLHHPRQAAFRFFEAALVARSPGQSDD